MMAMQYEHAGLGAAWPLIEAALLAPGKSSGWTRRRSRSVRLADGEARIALLDDEGWAAQRVRAGRRAATRNSPGRAFDRFQMRQRQLAALLEAHGIPATLRPLPRPAAIRAIDCGARRG